MQLTLSDINIFFEKKHFLGPINVSFESGSLNLIVGRSGSGKSTLLKLLAGFHSNYTGNITLDGNKFISEGNISLAFQNPETLFFNSTVYDEVAYSLTVSDFSKFDIENKTNDWLIKWGLFPENYSNKYPFKLSEGEKRRVALAACTILSPKVILLDEPLAGLDRVGQKDLSEIINSLTSEHIVIVVTHEPEILIQEKNKIFLLNDSKLIESNT